MGKVFVSRNNNAQVFLPYVASSASYDLSHIFFSLLGKTAAVHHGIINSTVYHCNYILANNDDMPVLRDYLFGQCVLPTYERKEQICT